MLISASVFGVSLVVTAVVVWGYSREVARGERLVFPTFRIALDRVCADVGRGYRALRTVVYTFFLQLWWRYLVHVSLRVLLVTMSRLYDRLIEYFEYNRTAAKTIKKQRRQWQQGGHLSSLAQHKAETALTESEKRRRRHAALHD